jgi:hypothetical protein
MDRSRIFRLLRISISAACAIACLLLLALWTRSYWRNDSLSISFDGRQAYMLRSVNGECALFAVATNAKGLRWKVEPYVVGARLPPSVLGFRRSFSRTGSWPVVQYWSPATLFAILAIVFAFTPRFSLVTLLLVMTLISGVLGISMARDWVNTEPQNTIPDLPPSNAPLSPGFTPVSAFSGLHAATLMPALSCADCRLSVRRYATALRPGF